MHPFRSDGAVQVEMANLYRSGVGANQIGLRYSCSEYLVREILKAAGVALRPRGRATRATGELLDGAELGALYGTLLGDAGVYYVAQSKTPRVQLCHCAKQFGYLEYKAERLSKLSFRMSPIYASDTRISRVAASSCLPQLKLVRDTVYPDGRKSPNEKWLSQVTLEGLAWWYMDDGHAGYCRGRLNHVSLHTEGFTLDENELLAAWLASLGHKVEIQCNNKRTVKYHHLRFRQDEAVYLIDRLRQYSVPCLDYKFPRMT